MALAKPLTGSLAPCEAMPQPANLELVHVTKRYGSTTAVDAINLRVAAGEYCCLLGPSGCGKTSTLRMIAGHESASEGDILIGAANVTDLPPAKRGTAMMFQSYALFPHLSCLDNVAFSLKMKGVDKATRHAKAMDYLNLVAMEPYAARVPAQLSGGQQQRVALGARARHRSANSPARRAALRARSFPAGAHARRIAADAEAARHSLRPCHARPGRSARPRRSRRGDEQGQDRTGGLAQGSLRKARHRIRRALPWRP